MNCPVCHHNNISLMTTSCPSCGTNLASIKMLEALEEQYVETVKNKVNLEGGLIQQKIEYELALKKKQSGINWLWLVLFLIPLIYWLLKRPPLEIKEDSMVVQHDSLDIYKLQKANQQREIATLHQKLRAIEGTRNIRELHYVVKEGDSLNELGKLFYNDSTAWYQIALDNKIYDVRGLPIGDTLVINYRE